MTAPTLRLEFCGEWHTVGRDAPFTVGRDADLDLDENPYLHRRFLELRFHDGLWWMTNLGTQLSATVSDRVGRFQAWLAPAARLPIVFETVDVRFSAGPTSYAFSLHLREAIFHPGVPSDVRDGTTTLGRVVIEGEQLLLVLALAEPALRAGGAGRVDLPTSAAAAARLGWPLTKFNRKLDHLCQKLKRAGVHGLHGDVAQLATDRRARLVEYALALRLVSASDLGELDTVADRPDHLPR
jgi:hypothetical protein